IGATKRVKVGTAVLVMPYRNPLLLARMLVTLDNFSGGRVILGAGVGWLEEEFEVLSSYDFKRRGKATDEYIEIFKAIAGGGKVGYQGETYNFAPVYSVPGSVQRPHPPVLVGGIADAALRRVAKYGNGWLGVAASTEKVKERLEKLRQFTTEAGRRFEDLALTYKIFLNIGEPKRSRFDAREPGTGSVEEIIGDLRRMFELGFTRVIVRYRGSSADEMRRQIDRFVTEIVPKA
ncbi:MAG TPA: TIGR03619 family F420-dependent LLM class oxidoreductase, partial [Hyphomicrobiaceae bacterium]|nr:TIGR03619 family F420-dependent LLM class oxidoreductase [Hyphomicrobiaceae bacterium]